MVALHRFDGTAYVATCPIQIGENFTYRFQVNEIPGTYFWHGHVGTVAGDGFRGARVESGGGSLWFGGRGQCMACAVA